MKHFMTKVLAAAMISAIVAGSSVSAQTGTVIADMLNVRTSPSMSGEVVDALYAGDQVTITYSTGDWYEIYRGGDCYYINAAYVSSGSSNGSSYSSSSYDGGSSYDYDNSSYDYDSYDYDSYDESEAYTETSSSSSGTYLGNFKLTAYCDCAQCCGVAGNATASGVYPTSGHTVAMGGVPFGTKLLINGTVYTVEDRGTPYGHVDIFFDSHSEALNFGLQYADVYQLN